MFLCLSMRHYPDIGMQKYNQLNLDTKQEHEADISYYVANTLHVEDDTIKMKMFARARHIFLWAVLVVQRLNLLHDNGTSTDDLRAHLADIPSDLHSIFKMLLHGEQDISSDTITMLQLMLPLSLSSISLCVVSLHKG